jgi:hydroxymethylbilane synthase
VPLAAFAQWTDAGALRLRTFVALPDGSRKLAAEGEATPTTLGDADALGVRVAQQMLDGGAREILAALVVDTPPAT